MQAQKSNSKIWENYWESEEHQPIVLHKELFGQIKGFFKDIRGKKIMEVGAGMGGDSIELLKKGAEVTVVDFSQKALDYVQKEAKKAKVEIKIKKENAENLSFDDESYDCIFHQGLLEHFIDPDKLLSEQWRVLKKGGILVVDVPQKYTTYTIKKHILMAKGQWFAGWEKEFSITELENLLKKYGFKILSEYGWGYYGKLYKLRNLKLGEWYEKLWKKIENSRYGLYLYWCIGIMAKK